MMVSHFTKAAVAKSYSSSLKIKVSLRDQGYLPLFSAVEERSVKLCV